MASEEEETPNSTEETPKEEESTATFEPIVQLDEVEVVSGEENEDVLYSQRAKLYVFGETMLNRGTGNMTWNERGVGDVRFLQEKDAKTIRILMRQERTMKTIVNHHVDHRIEIMPNAGSDRAWMWRAFDFSDGQELVDTKFSLKFKDSDIAQKFKEEFESAIKIMKDLDEAGEKGEAAEGAEAPGGGEKDEADEAAEKLAALTTSDEK